MIPLLAPWVVFFVVGVLASWRDVRARRPMSPAVRGLLVAVLMVIVPIVIMSVFRDRKGRYLLPMAIPAAVVAARGLMVCLADAKARWVVGLHWLGVAVITIGFPIAAATGAPRNAGG